MHGSSLSRMGWFVERWLQPGAQRLKVLDVGSCAVAGGSYRQLFDSGQYDYIGLDLAPGPNVDFVPELPYCWKGLANDSFDAVISGQAFEHMEFFWLAALEMARVLKPGGLMCIAAPRGFARHRYPVDCYRFDADGMLAIAKWCGLEPLHASTDMMPPGAQGCWHIEACEDSLLIARKPEAWRGQLKPEEYRFAPTDMAALAGDFAACPPLPPPVAQTVPQEEHDRRIQGCQAVIASMAQELDELRRRVGEYERSRSWRLTEPLRRLGKWARALRRR